MSTKIRPWHQDDLEVVRYLLWETWKESYSSFIPVDDLLVYFNENYTSKKLAEQYNDAKVNSFVAEYDDVIAGYEKTYYNEKENRLYVHQLYVLSVYQNLGLGRKLMRSAAKRAQSLGLDKVWVGVMAKNESAIEWYKKMGYEIVENEPFTMGKTTVDHFIGFVPVGRILTGDNR
ncbi:MAG: GNAT family N-acetyltransferase [Ignavibacteriales bacterium]|nr:GNAT family N-acetyltransferase [Ignavibacteriales bacterium]